MAIGREPGLEQPDQWFDAPTSAMTCMGSDPRTSSGPAVTVTASTGRTHDRTRPLPEHQKALAKRRPSTPATEDFLQIDLESGPNCSAPGNWSILNWSFRCNIPGWEEWKTMKASKFTDAQKAFILKQAPTVTPFRRSAGRRGSARRPISIGRRSMTGFFPTRCAG